MTNEAHQPGVWSWQSRAACRGVDADVFFPAADEDPVVAKAVCAQCPVRIACLGFAIEHAEKYGIWGGLTERERNRLPAAEREKISAEGRELNRRLAAA
ncbi:MAG: WhiB family transcriptional regulator [Actinomycetota bacterium]|nr:WhiB family transcriptional regulator [Actinomycetota bacterium]